MPSVEAATTAAAAASSLNLGFLDRCFPELSSMAL